ncbi:MAG: diguanylate cyclase [Nitrospirales bacterium]|nr:GGDEF domain-containing protein [Nitrospirales bacterium]
MPETESTADKALESLARILRVFGRHAFELEDLKAEAIEKEFERWAMHVLVGTVNPNEANENTGRTIRRDWGELARFVNIHRQKERQYVTKNLQDVREVLWEFTRNMGQAVIEDQETDQKVSQYLTRLQEVTVKSSFAEMKQALLSAVQSIKGLVDERKQRQDRRVQQLGEKLRSVERELGSARKQMMEDPLTRLFNRGALDEHLERLASLSFFSGSPTSLLMVDIDFFKRINDTYGHSMGDAVLQQLADRLVSTFPRKSDFIARYGGEEFCVLLSGTGIGLGQRLGERLLESVRSQEFTYQDQSIPVTASIGGAELLQGESVTSWLERADRALYRAKENGRNQMCVAQETREVA